MGNKSSKTKNGNKEVNKNKNNSSIKKNKKEKTIIIHYNGNKQTLKYYGNFDFTLWKLKLKIQYLIEEPIGQIFFQDKEGDILVINQNIPDNISVNLFVLKDLIPKNPTTALKIPNKKNKKKLLKFHWILEN